MNSLPSKQELRKVKIFLYLQIRLLWTEMEEEAVMLKVDLTVKTQTSLPNIKIIVMLFWHAKKHKDYS